ncbi:MAG: hypothetical protein F6K34_01435 [Okeania sp. SIO4D6]|nr:hypothetical protein [Okeania sp. SIO4D6]
MSKKAYVIAKVSPVRQFWYLRKGHFTLFMPNLDMAETFTSIKSARLEIEKRFGKSRKSEFRVIPVLF